MSKSITSQIKELCLSIDMVSKRKGKDVYILRQGYFYTNGMDECNLAELILIRLGETFPNVKVVDKGNKWVPFKGGHTVAQGSHFWVEVTV